jgi:transcriptional regulator GlxA family with amidase domain
MSRARELLAGSALSVKQISFRLGFTDPYHFSRIFKRKTGFAPLDWREKSARPRRS